VTEAKVNSKSPDRGPLLIISGEKDNTVPWAIAKPPTRNSGATLPLPRSSRSPAGIPS
jgi:hypothetical protein